MPYTNLCSYKCEGNPPPVLYSQSRDQSVPRKPRTGMLIQNSNNWNFCNYISFNNFCITFQNSCNYIMLWYSHYMDQFKSTTNFMVSTVLRTKISISLTMHRWFLCLFDVRLPWRWYRKDRNMLECEWIICENVCVCVVIIMHCGYSLLKVILMLYFWQNYQKCFTFLYYHFERYKNIGIIYIPGIESRWGRNSAPVQTGPVTHPASNTVCASSFPGVKRPERALNHQRI